MKVKLINDIAIRENPYGQKVLTLYNIYTVVSDDIGYYSIINDDGTLERFWKHRFEQYDYREEKIKKILE